MLWEMDSDEDTPVRPGGPPGWPPADPAVGEALAAAVRDGTWGQYHGPHVRELEAELAAYFGVAYVLTCASGTLAVEAGLRAVGVQPGDEVILAAYEYESNFLSVHAIGAKPVLVDVRPGTASLDPAGLPDAFGPTTRAVLVSHLHGSLADMPAILAACKSRSVAVVEDAAQCPGAVLAGKKAGAWGDGGVLSFGGSKLLSAGRGGAILFRDAATHQRAKVWLTRGVQQWAALSELQAIVLRPQLALLPERTVRRQRAVERIVKELSDVPGLVAFDFPSESEKIATDALAPVAYASGSSKNTIPGFYKVGFHFDCETFGLPREVFCQAMRGEGIAFDAGFKALHLSRAPSRFRLAGTCSEATRLHHQCVILHHPVLLRNEDEVGQVARAVRKVYRNRTRLSARAQAPNP
ncbi:MAG TPA: aminotransferase class V-fold PLP-dependent enzyme [Fimbriiglobus sp.]|jgi:dTDP-4-amino-4,6-dideoxygalactose transaminase